MTEANSRRKPHRTYSRHGITRLKGAVRELGPRVIDRRTTLGKALAQWRSELLQDLGGAEAVSTQEMAVVELAVKTKLLLDSVDAWLLVQPSLVNVRKRALLPVVRERTQLADALARYMTQLGLKRRARPVPSLQDYVVAKYAADGVGGQQKREETETFPETPPPPPPSLPVGEPEGDQTGPVGGVEA